MNLGLKEKRALVTGGASGIGRAIAVDLSKEGAKVIITSRNRTLLRKTMQEIGGEKNGHLGIVIDVSKEGAPAALAKRIWKDFGQLDIVVNNVGSTLNILDPYCSISDWRNVFRVNFEVAVEISTLFIPHMKKQDWGRIVNISSLASLENSGPVTYCAAKTALTAYTRCMGRILATEATNVVMSAVLPGIILTETGHWQNILKKNPDHYRKYVNERCPLGRLGTPAEISPTVLLLCSELATFSHGAIVPVDAGQSRHYFFVQGIGN